MTTPKSDSKTAVEGTAVPILNTAVIVTSGPLFDSEPPPVRIAAGHRVTALTRVAGLSLFLRAVLTLQQAGITRLLILADRQEEELRRCLSDEPRLTALVRWIPTREFPPHDLRTWEALAADLQDVCLVAGVHGVFSRALIERLRREAQDGDAVLAVTFPADGARDVQESADLLVLPARILHGSAGHAERRSDGHPLRSLMNQAAAAGRLRTIATAPDGAQWYRPVRHGADAEEAGRFLLQSLRSDLDGFVDAYFNRKVSRVLTRLFLFLRWSPNAITSLSILIGVAAAAFFSFGGYLAGVAGAVLFQVSAIVDCCDGDVARLTFRESRFGAQLDLLGDNAVHLLIFAALGWAGYSEMHSFVPLGLGAGAIVGSALSLWFVTRLAARRPPAVSAQEPRPRSDAIVRNFANRDFSVVVLGFALVNALGVFLWLAAVGSNVFWMAAAWAGRTSAER